MAVPVFRQSAIDRRILVSENVPAAELSGSHLLHSTMFAMQYIQEHGYIGLTKSRAFNRKFVTSAVEQWHWPGYTAAELYRYNKALNEVDVLPLTFLHNLLRDAQIIRHRSGKAFLSKFGQSLLGAEAVSQALLFETLYTKFDFTDYERWPSAIQDMDVLHYLGVVQHHCTNWIDFIEFADYCLPIPYYLAKGIATEEDAHFHVYARVVRPLVWLGLLEFEKAPRLGAIRETKLRHTPLFKLFLGLDFDDVSGVSN